MSSRPLLNSALLLLLVLGCDRKEKPRTTEGERPRVEAPAPTSKAPCQIRVAKNGIWMEGRLVDSTGAAAYCRIHGGSAEVEVERDAPDAISDELERTFKDANVPAAIHRQ